MTKNQISSNEFPSPSGSYPNARKVGNILFLSSVGPRRPGTNVIPGVMMTGKAMQLAMILKFSAIRPSRM